VKNTDENITDEERQRMNKYAAIEALTTMNEEELKAMRKLINKHIGYKPPGKRFNTYIPNESLQTYPIVLKWLKTNNIIEEETDYEFTKCAIKSLIKSVVEQIQQERKVPNMSNMIK